MKKYFKNYSSPQVQVLLAQEESVLCTSMTGGTDHEEYQTETIEW